MPIYMVKCRDCGEYEDIHRDFYDTDISACACGGERRKVYSVGGVTFKGNGFYRTDNAAKED